MTDKQLQKIIERLKSSEEESDEKGYKGGKRDGIQWAKNAATVSDLRIVSESEADSDEVKLAVLAHWASEEVAYFFPPQFLPDVGLSSRTGYQRGFADGAVSVWNAVKDQFPDKG